MELILFATGFFLGGFTGDIVLRRGQMIYRFGLLTACRWYREDQLVSVVPVFRYIFILLLLGSLFATITCVVIVGYPDYIAPYFMGMAIMLYYGKSKSAGYRYNDEDFVKYNIEYIRKDET